MSSVHISAHRGNCGVAGLSAPEGYKRALELAVDYVEFDVRRLKDGTCVVFHDARTPAKNYLCDLTYEEYQQELGAEALTVAQLLEMAQGKAGLQMDLKEEGYELEVVALALQYLKADDFVITTLEDASVRLIKEQCALQALTAPKVGLSLGRRLKGASLRRWLAVRFSELFPGKRLEWCHADFVAAHYRLASAHVLRYCQRRHVPVWVWTVDKRSALIRFLRDPGVTTLITNKPHLALALRSTLSEKV